MNPFYNALPGPEAASKGIDPAVLDELFADCFQIAKQYDLVSSVGLYLLHRHQTLKDDEAIVESQYGDKTDGLGFISRPLRTDSTQTPASWMMRDGAIHPFEYVDAGLSGHVSRYTNADAVAAMLKRVEEKGLSEYVGVGVTNRPAIRPFDSSEILVERDGPIPRSQLVQYEPWKGLGKSETVATRWVLQIPERINAPTGHCIPLIICIKYSPGHAEENQGHLVKGD